MGCSCCITYNSQIIVGGADISNDTISISVDSSQDVLWEDRTDQECNPIADSKIYLFGPNKATVQLTAYPFRGYDDYQMGFTCPVDINATIPWKYVFDCRGCVDCIDPETGAVTGQRRGRWVGVPLKKRIVQVTGDVDNVGIFQFSGCPSPLAKYTLTAGPQSVITPQPSMQYDRLQYSGIPVEFDTDNVKDPFVISINSGGACDWVTNFNNVSAYLTGFTFQFRPPAPPQVTYTFDAMPAYCVDC
jgi:hypothetical protein